MRLIIVLTTSGDRAGYRLLTGLPRTSLFGSRGTSAVHTKKCPMTLTRILVKVTASCATSSFAICYFFVAPQIGCRGITDSPLGVFDFQIRVWNPPG